MTDPWDESGIFTDPSMVDLGKYISPMVHRIHLWFSCRQIYQSHGSYFFIGWKLNFSEAELLISCQL